MPWDFWLIFLIVGAFVPWRGQRRMRHIMALPEVAGRDRMRLYFSTILFQWLLTAFVGWRAISRGLTSGELGLTGAWQPSILLITFAGALLIAWGHWMNLRRMAGAGTSHPSIEFLRAMAARIFPRSNGEILVYVVLALTAGICEEFIFRGFMIAALVRAEIPGWTVVA